MGVRSLLAWSPLLPVAALLLQIACDHFHLDNSPATALAALVVYAHDVFEWLGRTWAWASSFLALLEWEAVIESAMKIARPCGELLWTPFSFLAGYVQVAQLFQTESSDRVPLIFLGSVILLPLLVTLVAYRKQAWDFLSTKLEAALASTPIVPRYPRAHSSAAAKSASKST